MFHQTYVSPNLYHIQNLTLLHSESPKYNFGLSECNRANVWIEDSVDSDEVAHYEPPHLNLRCLPIQLFPFFGAFLY